MLYPILVVEDDPKIAHIVKVYLEGAGFRVTHSGLGKDALEAAKKEKPLLIILDLMLPDMSGEELCLQLKDIADVPIIMLTAKASEEERVAGFALGADDYVVKPFSPRELVARVKAILRRGRLERSLENRVLSRGDLALDEEKRKVSLRGQPVPLTPHEFTLLKSLMSSPGKVFTRDELLSRLYPKEDVLVIDRVVDVHIGKLRQKIEEDPSNPRYVLTVRGVGYQFSETAGR